MAQRKARKSHPTSLAQKEKGRRMPAFSVSFEFGYTVFLGFTRMTVDGTVPEAGGVTFGLL